MTFEGEKGSLLKEIIGEDDKVVATGYRTESDALLHLKMSLLIVQVGWMWMIDATSSFHSIRAGRNRRFYHQGDNLLTMVMMILTDKF